MSTEPTQYWTTVIQKPLRRIDPAAAGVDAAGVLDFIDALESTPEVEPHSLMLLRHGMVVAQGWWRPYSAARVHLLYSLSKSFTSSAVGFAVAEGLMSLDETVLSYFPELDRDITDPRSRSMLVRHVAAMASGHRQETVGRAQVLDPTDMVRGFLLIPPDDEPGSVFAYNQPCTFALAAIVQRVSGQMLTDFLRPRLFDPLGIGAVGWSRDASGREIGYSGFHATTEAVAKLGQLYLQRGRWEGRQILSAEWIAEATRSHIDNADESNPDWRRGYGFQFWMSRHGYRGDGACGQYCIVLPEYDSVLAMTGQSQDMQAVLDAVWRHLLPAMRDTTTAPSEVDVALSQRLSTLGLRPAPGGPAPAGVLAQSFTAVSGNDQPGLTEVVLSAGNDGMWNLTFVEGDSRIEAVLDAGGWTVTDVMAISGGWTEVASENEMCVDVAFIETPHRLRLRCHPDTGSFDARWVIPPLHAGPLAQLRMP